MELWGRAGNGGIGKVVEVVEVVSAVSNIKRLQPPGRSKSGGEVVENQFLI